MVFGNVRDVCGLERGLVAVADGARPAVFILDSTLALIDTLAPLGSGPGEFNAVTAVCGTPNGGLLVLSVPDWKCIEYRLDESTGWVFEREFIFGESYPPSMVASLSDGRFAGITRVQVSPDSLGLIAAVWSEGGSPDVVLRTRLAGYDPYGQWQSRTGMRLCVDSADRIYVADLRPDVRSIVCFDPSGEAIREWSTEVEPLRKSEEELEEQLEFARRRWYRATGSMEGFGYEPEPCHNSIRSLQVDGSDRIWIGYGAGGTDFDLISGSGEHLLACRAVLPQWQECSQERVWIESDRFFSSPYDPAQMPIFYRLELVEGY